MSTDTLGFDAAAAAHLERIYETGYARRRRKAARDALGPSLLRASGFRIAHARAIGALDVAYTPDGMSHGLASLVAAFVPGRMGVTEGDVTDWLADLVALDGRGDYVFWLNQHLYAVEKA